MSQYNIIYNSPDNETYLWGNHAFDKLANPHNIGLRFSGKDFKEDELKNALEEAIEAAKKQFPSDTNPEITVVEIKVS